MGSEMCIRDSNRSWSHRNRRRSWQPRPHFREHCRRIRFGDQTNSATSSMWSMRARARDLRPGTGNGHPHWYRGSTGHFETGERAGTCSRSSCHYGPVSFDTVIILTQYVHPLFGRHLWFWSKFLVSQEKKEKSGIDRVTCSLSPLVLRGPQNLRTIRSMRYTLCNGGFYSSPTLFRVILI